MRAFHLILAIAPLLVPLSAYGLAAQQTRTSINAEPNASHNRSASSVSRLPTPSNRPLNALWRNKPANVRVGFVRTSAQAASPQPQTPVARPVTTAGQGDRRNPRNRLHLQIRTPLGWVRVRLAS